MDEIPVEPETEMETTTADDCDWSNYKDTDVMQQQSAIWEQDAAKFPFVGDKSSHHLTDMIILERFFFVNSPKLQHDDFNDNDDSMILLSGPPSSGKTSLLFQFAFNTVLNNVNDTSVVFICNRHKLETKPPLLSKGIDPSSHLFNRIQMKYVEDEEGINNFFAAFHIHHTFPVSVIIDDLGQFFDERKCQQRYRSPRGKELAIVRTLALCRNAVDHANETGPCVVLFSDTYHGETLRFLHIYKQWVNSIYTIKGDGIGSFILKNNSYLETRKTTAAKYSIALQHLVLEDIYENEEQRQVF